MFMSISKAEAKDDEDDDLKEEDEDKHDATLARAA